MIAHLEGHRTHGDRLVYSGRTARVLPHTRSSGGGGGGAERRGEELGDGAEGWGRDRGKWR